MIRTLDNYYRIIDVHKEDFVAEIMMKTLCLITNLIIAYDVSSLLRHYFG